MIKNLLILLVVAGLAGLGGAYFVQRKVDRLASELAKDKECVSVPITKEALEMGASKAYICGGFVVVLIP